MSKIISIDLGTTSARVGVFENGQTTIIPNSEGKLSTPCVVVFTKDNTVLVGDEAIKQAIKTPKNTLTSIKKLMGLRADNENMLNGIAHQTYGCVDNKGMVGIFVNEKTYTPQEIIARILQKLKKDAQAYIGEILTQCFISIPSYFNNEQRKVTIQAAKLVGFKTIRLINENSAAAVSYEQKYKKDGNILVYSMGGGNFEVSCLDISDGTLEVLSCEGETFLGGDTFDNLIITYLAKEFENEHDIDLKSDKMALHRLKIAVKDAKEELSNSEVSEINLPYITMVDGEAQNLFVTLTRDIFEDLIGSTIDKTILAIKIALSDADLDISEIDEVVLVGGSTKIALIRNKISQIFNENIINTSMDCETTVCDGLVKYSEFSGGVILILDIIVISLGIETLGGVMTKLIEKGSTLPIKRSQVFSTAEDNQEIVSISLLQGENELAKDNRDIGGFELGDIVPAKQGVPQIEVTFDVDSDGIVNVSSIDKTNQKAQKVNVSNSAQMSDEELKQKTQEISGNELDEDENVVDDKYIQMKTDFENIKKRLEKEKQTAVEFAQEKLAKDLLVVVDSLETAIKVSENSSDELVKNLRDGVKITLKQLLLTLHKHGIEQVKESLEVDSNIHQVIQEVDSDDVQSGQIVQTFQKGYKYKTRTLRDAMVSIAS